MNRADRPVILWFREDLRLADHPALVEAARTGRPVLPLFIFDAVSEGIRPLGGASIWWLHHSLASLAADLHALGSRLVLRRGPSFESIAEIAKDTDPEAVFWTKRYGEAETAIDNAVAAMLRERSVDVRQFAGRLLHDPMVLKTKQGGSYRVFTPFYRALRAQDEPRIPLPAPASLTPFGAGIASEPLDSWELRPRSPDWAQGLRETWAPGEAGAHNRLNIFADGILGGYNSSRDIPGSAGTSMLSPHLRFGEISPFQIKSAVDGSAGVDGHERFLSEIGWREFSYHLLAHHPRLAVANFQSKFDNFRWRTDHEGLRRWQEGRTGYPIVDAGMRQLWTIGWMHNRVRMIAASFLIKHLLIDWRLGEEWFWDTLVDADPAANAASWQWVAGSGADASPYFRIFNPIAQGEKFDPDGDYVRHWVPELRDLPSGWIHTPWTAPDETLNKAGIRLGETYPHPIIDHRAGRERALRHYAALSGDGVAARPARR